ncbi:hypothetical protein CesoFtcFv8_001509 [Champsocephalus esox]|uniref:Uncharacterized protein n=1 Tax=Champsocephalus esox TaxID=159716 RepID=A0AAN8HGZ3_9TELE|nr:hypothetical protein CesoFtcFv8_001509 [Champsocephalus esox]
MQKCVRADGPSECTTPLLLIISALPEALIQAITERLETLADICLSTELRITSLISICGDGWRGGRTGGGEVDREGQRHPDGKMIKNLARTIRDGDRDLFPPR